MKKEVTEVFEKEPSNEPLTIPFRIFVESRIKKVQI